MASLKYAARVALMMSLLFLLIEGTARLYDAARGRTIPCRYTAVDYRICADGYRDKSWLQDYYEDINARWRTAWQPYVYFRSKPLSGKNFNIDSAGLRVTVPSPTRAPEARIFFFGGSTMVGLGAKDDETIASASAQSLKERCSEEVDVRNFGQGGYNSTQEMLTLMLEMRSGNVPTLAVFYDGLNDVWAAIQTGRAGVTLNEDNRQAEFQILNTKSGPAIAALSFEIRASEVRRAMDQQVFRLHIYHVLASAKRRVFASRASAPVATPTARFADQTRKRELGEQVGETYAANMEIIRTLASHFHVDTLFFWQPNILDKPRLSEFEAQFQADENANRDVHESAKSRLRRAPPAGWADISDTFEHVEQPVFLDAGHITGDGYRMVADRMLPAIVGALQGRGLCHSR